jgi:acetolactate synthase-1/2/3 large subunit
VFLIWNNSGYSEIRRFMTDGGIAPIGVDIHGPDFVGLGQAFGCAAARVATLTELQTQLLLAQQRSGPTLIEVREEQFVDGFPMG